jgi:signal transduction histidine kinase
MSPLRARMSSPLPGTYPEVVRGVRAWLRDHPWQADIALAALLAAISVGQSMADPAIAAVSAALAVTVIARRKYPVQAFAVAVTIAFAQVILGLAAEGGYVVGAWQPTVADLAVAVLLYTLAAHTARRTSIAGLIVCLILSAVAISRWSPAHSAHAAGEILAAVAVLGSVSVSAWVLGEYSVAYRYRAAYYAALEQRARAVDESAARLRRIERDLHDGAQVRLAALAMTLGEIKEALDAAPAEEDGGRARMLISAAHRNAKETLAELRDLARGIHPPVLDRGLEAALGSLAETSPTPVTLSVDITTRPSPAIEAIAYFCAAELLANIAKHSGASNAEISVIRQAGRLVMIVTDNGTGEARISAGGGLAGLLERVQTVDGHLSVLSPRGGPTKVTVALPGHA